MKGKSKLEWGEKKYEMEIQIIEKEIDYRRRALGNPEWLENGVSKWIGYPKIQSGLWYQVILNNWVIESLRIDRFCKNSTQADN